MCFPIFVTLGLLNFCDEEQNHSLFNVAFVWVFQQRWALAPLPLPHLSSCCFKLPSCLQRSLLRPDNHSNIPLWAVLMLTGNVRSKGLSGFPHLQLGTGPHLWKAWKCEARLGLMWISKTKSCRGEERWWALIYWRFMSLCGSAPTTHFLSPLPTSERAGFVSVWWSFRII